MRIIVISGLRLGSFIQNKNLEFELQHSRKGVLSVQAGCEMIYWGIFT